MARGTLMFVGLLGAKNVGGTSGSPKKEDGELDDGLGEGPFMGGEVGKRRGASGVCWMRVVNREKKELVKSKVATAQTMSDEMYDLMSPRRRREDIYGEQGDGRIV